MVAHEIHLEESNPVCEIECSELHELNDEPLCSQDPEISLPSQPIEHDRWKQGHRIHPFPLIVCHLEPSELHEVNCVVGIGEIRYPIDPDEVGGDRGGEESREGEEDEEDKG